MTVTLSLGSQLTDSSTRRALSDISLSVAKSKKIVVVTGAGISCSCGIPDFRSSDGLYALVKQKYPDVVLKGRDLFDASLFRDPTSTSVFYTFISQLKQSIDAASPTPTHRFIKTLDTKHKLLRSYTQNIDGLETRAGLLGSASEGAKATGKGKSKIKTKEVKNVQLHGDIHRVRCTFCSAESPCTDEDLKLFNGGSPPDCPECLARSEARVARSARPLKIGTLRPAIVLYDEPHPLGDDIGTIQTADIARKPDMLIIMGTSLKVHGLKKLVKDFAKAVHASATRGGQPLSPKNINKSNKSWSGKVIFVNRTAPPVGEWSDIIDYHIAGETDTWVDKVVDDWKRMRPTDWEVQKTLDGADEEDSPFKIVKIVPMTKTKTKAGKKKLNVDSENIPPSELPSEPISKPSQSTPVSPSKRRQAASHYSDVECSPSKKRDIAAATMGIQKLALEDRGLLFGNNCTNAKVVGANAEVATVDAKIQSTADSRRTRPGKVVVQPKKAATTKQRVEMWVEVEMVK